MLRVSSPLIRPLHLSELDQANEWARGEGWNPGLHDAEMLMNTDPGSMLTVETGGQLAGVIASVRITEHFGYLSFFVIAPAFRRTRCGWTLWHASLERLGDRVIGADSCPERIHNYTHYGLLPCYSSVAYEGLAPATPAAWHPRVELAARTKFSELASYDAHCFGVARTSFLQEWLNLPGSRSLVFKQDGRIRGLGTVRRCHKGVRIGPLHAEDPEAAGALFDALVGIAPGDVVSIDCPEPNPEAAKLALSRGMVAGPVTTRMYRGTPPAGAPGRVYGVMSFTLG